MTKAQLKTIIKGIITEHITEGDDEFDLGGKDINEPDFYNYFYLFQTITAGVRNKPLKSWELVNSPAADIIKKIKSNGKSVEEGDTTSDSDVITSALEEPSSGRVVGFLLYTNDGSKASNIRRGNHLLPDTDPIITFHQ